MIYIILRLLLERIYLKMSFHIVKRLFESFWFKLVFQSEEFGNLLIKYLFFY